MKINRKDTRLLPFLVEYEKIMKNTLLSDEENDLQLSSIMTEMEQSFGIPYLNNSDYNDTNPQTIELYRMIENSRVTLAEEGIFQVGCKLLIVDGLQQRTAKAFKKIDTGSSVWYLCMDQNGEWGYSFVPTTIDWTGKIYVYYCQKHNTPLSMLTGKNAN